MLPYYNRTRYLDMRNPLIIILLLLLTSVAYAGSTQTNTSGSNTAIEGGYTSTATTTYQSGSSSNSTTTNNSTSNVRSAPPSAGAPSYNSMTQDVCAVGVSVGVQTFGLGVSGGKHTIDKNCERLKLARILNDLWFRKTMYVCSRKEKCIRS